MLSNLIIYSSSYVNRALLLVYMMFLFEFLNTGLYLVIINSTIII